MMDLTIIDIDDTFLKHRTVLAAKRLVHKMILNHFRPYGFVKFFYIGIIGILLHVINLVRIFLNRLNLKISNEVMIRLWSHTMVRTAIRKSDYQLPKDMIEKNLDKDMLNVLKQERQGSLVVAISEHFSCGDKTIKEILRIDHDVSNEFLVKDGVIRSRKLRILNGNDKLKIARSFIEKYKPKRIRLIIEDYDDLSLLRLQGIFKVIVHKKLKRFIDKKKFVYDNKFNSFLVFRGGVIDGSH